MIVQRRYEAVRPAPVRARRRSKRVNLLRVLLCNRMVCVLLLALVVSSVLSVYVGAYATATETGYRRSDLVSQLKSLRLENEMLRLKLEQARQPSRIAEFALASGMEQSKDMVYLRTNEQPKIAQNLAQ